MSRRRSGLVALVLGCVTPGGPVAAADPPAKPPAGAWQVTLGVGLGVSPAYDGSSKSQLTPLPLLDITWKDRVFLSTARGLGVNIINTDNATLGIALYFSESRSEKDSPSRLRGTGKIDSAPTVRVFGDYAVAPVILSAEVTHALADYRPDKAKRDAAGTIGTLGVSLPVPLTDRLVLKPTISVSIADSDYMRTFFGVTRAQSRAGGRRAFNPGAGVRDVAFALELSYAWTEHWVIEASVGASDLVGDAGRSPVVAQQLEPAASVELAYHF